jgi:hypothetical protein
MMSEASESAAGGAISAEPAPAVRWSILVATLARRGDHLRQLLSDLIPQLAGSDEVEVVALRNHGERKLGDIRQSLVESARGEYLSFVDDDDRLPEYYVSEVLSRLDGVDYVGWQMQAYVNGNPLKPTYHSLAYDGWFETPDAYYRDTSHLNPVRTALARRCDFRATEPPEDVAWSDQLRGLVVTQHYVDRVMYHYYATMDSTWRPGHEYWDGVSDPLDDYTYHWANDIPQFRWHPEST